MDRVPTVVYPRYFDKRIPKNLFVVLAKIGDANVPAIIDTGSNTLSVGHEVSLAENQTFSVFGREFTAIYVQRSDPNRKGSSFIDSRCIILPGILFQKFDLYFDKDVVGIFDNT